MAVKVMQGITRYIGTAAEIAAYDISKANIGSTFFESDTGILKIVNQAGVLVNVPSESVSLSGSNALVGAIKNNVAPGTELPLHANYPCREVTIIAKRTNAGYIYVGGADVSSTVYGAELAAGDSVTIPVSNLNLVYIDASVAGEGVSYLAVL